MSDRTDWSDDGNWDFRKFRSPFATERCALRAKTRVYRVAKYAAPHDTQAASLLWFRKLLGLALSFLLAYRCAETGRIEERRHHLLALWKMQGQGVLEIVLLRARPCP